MTILFELLRDDAGKASLSYAFMAIAVVGFAAACSIKANLNPR
ncbi:MAG TPA: hypothetical protein VGR52_07140 [Stellaceae bacterium]|nr:hypothetical protein [Stellaceae bacterium]